MARAASKPPAQAAEGLMRAATFEILDLDLGGAAQVRVANGTVAQVRTVGIDAATVSLRGAVPSTWVKVEIAGHLITLGSGKYQLPRTHLEPEHGGRLMS